MNVSDDNQPGNGENQTSQEPLTSSSKDDSNDEDDTLDMDLGSDGDEGLHASKAMGVDPEIAKALAFGADTFEDLPLHERVREGIAKIGWSKPTPVQKLCLPYTLRGRDVAGFAQTGTGKTGVFLISIINRLLQAADATKVDVKAPRAVVLAPTRELAMQIEDDAQGLFQFTGIKSLAVFGGIDYDKQARALHDGVDVIVATPGRLKDYVQKKLVDLQNIQVFVCDEADRMFDMGFIEDVEFFLSKIPEQAQKLLFSATTNEEVKELAFEYLESPEYISVNPEVITPEKIEQHAIHCHATQKLKVMLGMLKDHNPSRSIIFTNTKLTAEWLHFKLEGNGIECDLITGDLPQNKRIRLIQRIKEGKLKALIATDVASRGLHIAGVTHVYNFDLPDDPANYVHRIGRTARAGEKGASYSLVCDDYGQNLAGINELLGEASVQSRWYDEQYMQIEDKAGNPFEERYRARQAEADAREARFREREAERERKPRQDDRTRQPERSRPATRPPASMQTSHANNKSAIVKAPSRSLFEMIKHLWQMFFGKKKKINAAGSSNDRHQHRGQQGREERQGQPASKHSSDARHSGRSQQGRSHHGGPRNSSSHGNRRDGHYNKPRGNGPNNGPRGPRQDGPQRSDRPQQSRQNNDGNSGNRGRSKRRRPPHRHGGNNQPPSGDS